MAVKRPSWGITIVVECLERYRYIGLVKTWSTVVVECLE